MGIGGAISPLITIRLGAWGTARKEVPAPGVSSAAGGDVGGAPASLPIPPVALARRPVTARTIDIPTDSSTRARSQCHALPPLIVPDASTGTLPYQTRPNGTGHAGPGSQAPRRISRRLSFPPHSRSR